MSEARQNRWAGKVAWLFDIDAGPGHGPAQ